MSNIIKYTTEPIIDTSMVSVGDLITFEASLDSGADYSANGYISAISDFGLFIDVNFYNLTTQNAETVRFTANELILNSGRFSMLKWSEFGFDNIQNLTQALLTKEIQVASFDSSKIHVDGVVQYTFDGTDYFMGIIKSYNDNEITLVNNSDTPLTLSIEEALPFVDTFYVTSFPFGHLPN